MAGAQPTEPCWTVKPAISHQWILPPKAALIYEDRAGRLWFNSAVGLSQLEPDGTTRQFPLTDAFGPGGPPRFQVNFFYEDSKGVLWLATETGLLRFDPKSQNYTERLLTEDLRDEPGRFGGGGGPPPNLPSDTYGELRDRDGNLIGSPDRASPFSDDQERLSLPTGLPVGEPRTVRVGDDTYRVQANRARETPGATVVVAVPMTETEATLERLLLVEALVILGVLVVLGIVASLLVRIGLRPLDRMATTAGIIAGGDLSRRVTPATAKTEVGRLGLALNAMLDRLEEAFAQRQESEHRLRRFLSDASHELRTPLASIRATPSCSGWAPRASPPTSRRR